MYSITTNAPLELLVSPIGGQNHQRRVTFAHAFGRKIMDRPNPTANDRALSQTTTAPTGKALLQLILGYGRFCGNSPSRMPHYQSRPMTSG